MTFENWIERANELLMQNYGISLADAGADEGDLRRDWSAGETPEEFIEWYAGKYDLAPASGVMLGGAVYPRSLNVMEPFDRDTLLRECLVALNAARAFSYHYASERRSSYDLAARVERVFREMNLDPYRIPEVQ